MTYADLHSSRRFQNLFLLTSTAPSHFVMTYADLHSARRFQNLFLQILLGFKNFENGFPRTGVVSLQTGVIRRKGVRGKNGRRAV
jgi:hypothetical protein